MKSIALKISAVLVVATLLVAGGWLWFANYANDGNEGLDGVGPSDLPPVGSGLWTPFTVEFQDPSYKMNPLDYTLPLTSDEVGNLMSVTSMTDMTPAQLQFLLDNGMVGLAKNGQGYVSFSAAYEFLQKDAQQPTFITSDSVLDAYHHIFEGVLIELEEKDLTGKAEIMAEGLMWASDAQVDFLLEEDQMLAKQNVVYFGVALRIFDPGADVPDYAEEDIKNIIEKIERAERILTVPGFHQEEDFSQYKPRGHYTRSEELSRYFKGMMWFGRITFQGKYDDETRRAVLASIALKNDHAAWNAYVSMSAVIDFMVGQPDDLTPQEVLEQMEEVMGPMDGSFAPLFDDSKLEELKTAIGKLRSPKINSDVVYPGEEVWGMRVFGQRYVPDSYIFQECVYDKVGTRFMPSCLDVFAVMGSEEAWGREDFDTHAPNLESQMTKLRNEFDSYPDHIWSSTLYWSWLHSLKSIHEPVQEERGPAFMQTRVWSAKELNAQAASWTQLTHDTILYRKQSYTRQLDGSTPSDIVYVEPVPELYSRLGDMVRATTIGLERLSMGSDLAFEKLEEYEGTLEILERVSIAQLEGMDPDVEDISSLRWFYQTLTRLNDMGNSGEDTKTILVSDVHTDPNSGQVLQEGVGPVRLMVVVIPTKQGNYAALGTVFEHYEFPHPMSDRLTDEQWTEMLESGTAPEPAPWAKDFNP